MKTGTYVREKTEGLSNLKFFVSLLLFIATVVVSPVMGATSTDSQIIPMTQVSLKDKAIQVNYALNHPGAMSVEIINMSGRTLNKWNWEDSTSGVFTRDLSLSKAAENQAVFVLVNGPDINAIQGLFTGKKDANLLTQTGISQSLPLNQKPPEDFGNNGGFGKDGMGKSPYGP